MWIIQVFGYAIALYNLLSAVLESFNVMPTSMTAKMNFLKLKIPTISDGHNVYSIVG